MLTARVAAPQLLAGGSGMSGMWSSVVGQAPYFEDWDRLRGDAMKVVALGVEARLGSIPCSGLNRPMSMIESFQVLDKGYYEAVGGGLSVKEAGEREEREEREECARELVTYWLALVGHWDGLN